jgi:hypothetical protein
MLPLSHAQPYQILRSTLVQLREQIELASPEPAKLRKTLQKTQEYFQQHILTLDLDELKPTDLSKVQSIQTEINKQLRLLETDILFLQAARQPTTVHQRQTQITDRLSILIQYCDAVLGDL